MKNSLSFAKNALAYVAFILFTFGCFYASQVKAQDTGRYGDDPSIHLEVKSSSFVNLNEETRPRFTASVYPLVDVTLDDSFHHGNGHTEVVVAIVKVINADSLTGEVKTFRINETAVKAYGMKQLITDEQQIAKLECKLGKLGENEMFFLL